VANISAKQVMDLRSATGLSMMKCKEALVAEGGDFEKAVDRLRKEGLKTADAKAGRATGEGLVRARVSDEALNGVMIAVVCETEPVSKTPLFTNFVDRLLDQVEKKRPKDEAALLAQPWIDDAKQTVDEVLRGLIAKTGENMKVHAVAHLEAKGAGIVSSYVHHNGKVGAMVALQADTQKPGLAEVARELCMHVVFSNPAGLRREDIPSDLVERERDIFREQMLQDPKMKGKPQQVLDNILKGKIEAFYGEKVLPDQAWFKPEVNKKVAQVLKEHGATIARFVRMQIGG
jgi:elongation factor Ts